MLQRTPFKTHEELGISWIDREGLIKVLDGFESGTITYKNFAMTGWNSCICGWAQKMTAGEAFPRLGGDNEVSKLFTNYADGIRSTTPTVHQCAIVLRYYLLTGKVDWELAL